jgi:Uma2 family endonuclease
MYMATKDPRSPRTPRKIRWTRAHLASLPDDGNRYEVLDGQLLVTPQARFRHQRIALRLSTAVERYCEAHGVGVVVGPGAVVFDNNELQPDLQVIPGPGPAALDPEWTDLPLPILVVEVLSSGSRRHDLVTKREAYLRIGIPEYWVVDVVKRHVLVCRPGSDASVVVTDTLRWKPVPHAPALAIDVRALLED